MPTTTYGLDYRRRQLRREDLDASSFHAADALGAKRRRKGLEFLSSHIQCTNSLFVADLTTRLWSSRVRLTKRPAEMPETMPERTTERDSLQLPAITPDNPTTPAFWMAEGRYRNVLADREIEKQRELSVGKSAVPRRKVSGSVVPHPSKAGFVDIPNADWMQPAARAVPKETAETPTRSIPETPPETETEKEIAEYKRYEPSGVDAMKSLFMRPPVPPQRTRRVYRLHHLT